MKPSLSVLPNYESDNVDVTIELVQRVSERVAIGIPLELAVAGEGLSREEYEGQLRERPELATIQDVTIREFIEDCIRKLLQAKDPSANIRWLLERLYPEIFGKKCGKAAERV
jgi:hypothetical protein